MIYIRCFLFLSVIVSAGAVLQQIEIFTEINQMGDSIVLTEKIPDLKEWKFFLAKGKSYCVIGHWQFFPSTNFTGSFMDVLAGNGGLELAYEQRRCADFPYFGEFNSARFAGPRDTRTIAISMYEGNENWIYSGTELVIEGRTGTNFPPIMYKTLVSHGGSNWTFFPKDNFEGTSSCLRFNGHMFQSVSIVENPVRSVYRDCL